MKIISLFMSIVALTAFADEVYDTIERKVASAVTENGIAQEKLRDRVSILDYSSLVKNVNGTNVWTSAFQKALDEHEIVVLPARAEKYYVDGVISIPSNRRIEADGATVRLLDGTCTILLSNANAKDGTLAPLKTDARDRNIAVIGGRWEDCNTRRRGYGGTGKFNLGRRGLGNYYGVSTLFFFNNCDNVSVRNATFHHCAAFAVQAGDGDAYVFEKIRFDDCFADGLHLNGNLTRVLCKDVKGKVGDDLVALNAYDWLNSSVNFGPQRYILCEDLELILKDGKGYPAIRIQPAKYKYADGSIVDCAISDVIFRNVKGIKTFKMYLQTPRYKVGGKREWAEIGTGGNLYFEKIDIDLDRPIDKFKSYMEGDPIRGHFGAFEFGANLSSIVFRDIDITFHADVFPLSHLATVGPKSIRVDNETDSFEIFDPYVNCEVGKVTLENIRAKGIVPKELVHATVFDNVNGDGESSGKGKILEIVNK